MEKKKEPEENVPLAQLNGQNTIVEENENDEREQPKSVSINNQEKNSESITFDGSDVTNEVSRVTKKAIKHENTLSLLNSDINSILLGPMQTFPADTTNGEAENGQIDAKKENTPKDAPDGFNKYRNQKSFSQGLLDIALFTSNVNQLRSVTKNPPAGNFEFYFVIFSLTASILLQIVVGLMLLLSARYNVNKEEERRAVYRMGNYVVASIFLITIFNLFIAVFYDYEGVVQPIMRK